MLMSDPEVPPPEMLPFISCVCPTFRRPEHLARSIEMFRQQNYPKNRRELIILEDGARESRSSNIYTDRVKISHHQVTFLYKSLPLKYTELVGMAKGCAIAIWEDDDEYKPDHLLSHALALAPWAPGGGREWSKPSIVLSDCENPPNHKLERSDGRFFASICFTRILFEKASGFVLTRRGDFDQQFMKRLADYGGTPGDPCEFREPQYVFRWHTGAYHGQNYMRSPDDEEWLDRARMAATKAPVDAI